MDDLHSLLVRSDDTPICSDLRGNFFRFDVTDDIADVTLKGFGFKVFLTKRTEGIHTEDDFAPVLTEHQCKRIESAIQGTDRIDGAVARLRIEKGADIEIFVGR